jgi:two-component sensor histidine kinase
MESLYALMGFVTSFAGKQGFSPEKIRTLELAMEEVLVNIIKYAYRDDDSTGSIDHLHMLSERGLRSRSWIPAFPLIFFPFPIRMYRPIWRNGESGGWGFFSSSS